MHSCRGSDRVCRWSFGAAGLFVLWKPHRGRWILGQFFGRSASWRRLVIPIYFMYGNRMTMGNRNEVKKGKMAGLCDPCDLHPLRGEHPQASGARPQSGIHRRRKSKTVSQLQPAAMARRLVDVWPWFLFMMAGGHVLIEDIPGVGKTSMALAFARAMNLTQNRVQFTPDVLPSDITGISMYIKEKDTFVYQPGAVMCNLFLADEINRTSAKTQSAFLEVMEEGTVTVDGVTRQVLDPFVVIATENPIGSAGTQMLPEPQLDRFLICIQMGYPSNADDSMADYLRKIVRLCQTRPSATCRP